jgi:hypothetical protein
VLRINILNLVADAEFRLPIGLRDDGPVRLAINRKILRMEVLTNHVARHAGK